MQTTGPFRASVCCHYAHSSATSFAQVLQDRDHGGSTLSHPAAGTLSQQRQASSVMTAHARDARFAPAKWSPRQAGHRPSPRLLSVHVDSLSIAEASRHRRSHRTTGLHRVSWNLMSAHTPTIRLLPLHAPSRHPVRGSRLLTQGRIFELGHAEDRSGHGGAQVAG